ncbi:NAD-dependent epimerase/dehydratase family protein [Aliarcobacter butzleri]|uniref:NAD-dependent epimerase/dehydratase family protein n=1 Tax=Aliarcobacter butzleri TaxID=28197 RepID=A0AAP4UYA8_9BACT|nr:NAD-dependent epimerase/dehydratase family protein [Aliarcobacter butzleri]MCT7556231.1 NAD-dependent epimerase/dehydratase family protein [Aliarcobacter butzleri]MCT7593287.1 NAD-dependent epimerase/dehydratase family protein [Aliarcobacter butzleri]MCT7597951.1 NAD-dependent epimerase/dehydratase family protein [Aliarcobacter butzleri]MDN5051958.1 NAD-dependent epimerase/dehydratase family protein [Aliarcobacter butzleri]MDN5074653.1 NAD-dependent epimerase/dehydratase family protein [Ali
MLKEDYEQIKQSSIDWKKFENKTILITGANGFLPAYMVETLLLLNKDILQNNKCKVIALVRNENHTQKRFSNFLDDENFEVIVQDVANDIKISDKIDFIIHAASPASPKYYNIDPIGVIMPNILGTKNTLELALKNNVDGYLYFSSGEVYGQLNDGEVVNEDKYGYLDPTAIRSCYGESKRMGENLCISYGHQCNIPIKIVRPAHTYGPGMKLDDGRVFADFVKNIINDENIEIKSEGSAIRPFCYLSDATVAFFKILLDGENNNAYNMANSKEFISIKELATILISLFPEKKLQVVFVEQSKNYLKSPVKGNIIDTTKLEKLGWKPTISINDGFKKTIRSYI